MTKDNRCYYLFLLTVALGMLVLNLFDAPTLSDDMVYRFKWNADENADVETINSLYDLISSQITHYMNVNGRFIVHLVAQSFLVFVPPVVTQVLNSIMFVLLLHLCTCLVSPSRRLFVSVVSCMLLFVVFQGFRSTMLWSLGAFNYLWVLVITMAFLLWLRRLAVIPFNRSLMWLSPLAILAGWSHEALSLPLSVAFAACLVFGKREWRHSAAVPFVVFYMVGSLLCLLSPGLWGRSADVASLTSRFISGAVNCLFNVRITWLLFITLFILWWRRRTFFYEHVRRMGFVYVALLFSMVIVLFCGTNLERVAFFNDFIAMLVLLYLMSQLLSAIWQRRVIILSSVLMLLSFVPAYMVRKENNDSWLLAEQQMREPGRELIAVTMPASGENVVMDYFREHYNNPSFEFGFYCCYAGFNANDINMRCAARLFDKERLYFLPEDVVKRAMADSLAFTDYELDSQGNLFVWRMQDNPRHQKIENLVFELNDEDPSTLSFIQRLLVYQGNEFELDDLKYDEVAIGSQYYLVFTRPTTNIFRRIKNIKYTVKQ